MKKLLILFIVGLLTASPLFAEEKKEVSLRFSRQGNIIRVVLESYDNFILNANIADTLSSIKIEFPALFQLKKPKDFIFETSLKDRLLIIAMKNIGEIRTYKLSSPARIVFDLTLAQNTNKEQSPKPELNPELKPDLKTEPTPELKPEAKPEQPVEAQAVPKLYVIDAGHGGYDYGILSNDSKEKDLNLLLTKDLSAALSKKGNKIFLTRKVDQSLSILERIILGNSRNPYIFISLHSSASNAFVVYTGTVDEPSTEASVLLYSLSARQRRHIEKSRALAKAIGTSLKAEFKEDVVTREMPLPILNSMDSTAVLIEYPSLQLNTYDQQMRNRVANAILKGIQSYE
ncbi:MAG: N-acetylmuramoyl-L-alanine amidase [Nitrospirota bacterium]|nr:N-acetylmuramoyl-L-alanine amidase [Nitrospirota bacterium]